MTRRYRLIALALPALLTLAAACAPAPSDRRSAASDTATPQPASALAPPISPPPAVPTSPPPTATPAPVLRSTGWLVYLRGNDLYLGALDGSGEQRLTDGSLGAGYAGYARIGGETWVYFTSAVERGRGADPWSGARIAAFRRSARDPARTEELFSFRGSGVSSTGDPILYTASVSPDGQHIAFTDGNGINRFDLDTHATVLLLANVSGGVDGRGGRAYLEPQWSPRGDLLVTTRINFETTVIDIVSLLGDVAERMVRGSPQPTWAPDGGTLCVLGEQGTGVGLLSPSDGAVEDLTGHLLVGGLTSGARTVVGAVCRWSSDGRIAVSYIPAGDKDAVGWLVAYFRPSEDNIGHIVLPVPYTTLVEWLPDGSGLVITGYTNCVPCPQPDPLFVVLLLDGTVGRLPFEADRVLGAIPAD